MEIFWLRRDNYFSLPTFYIRVSPLSLLEGEFRLSLIFLGAIVSEMFSSNPAAVFLSKAKDLCIPPAAPTS
jgi:hypothetical protein